MGGRDMQGSTMTIGDWDTGFLEAGVTGSCEQPNMDVGNGTLLFCKSVQL